MDRDVPKWKNPIADGYNVGRFIFPEEFMPSIQHVSAKNGDVVLLVGTMKGAFLLRSNKARKKWDIGGPHSVGSPGDTMAPEPRPGRGRVLGGSAGLALGSAHVLSG